jgi:isoquinoline 1-oxidoreductase beta subunit
LATVAGILPFFQHLLVGSIRFRPCAKRRAGWKRPQRNGIHQGVAISFWNGSVGAVIADVSMHGGTPDVHRVTSVVDCGRAINPDIVVAQVQGAINYGLSAALVGSITIGRGRVEQGNFDSYAVQMIAQAPRIDVFVVPSERDPSGIGELGTPGIAPAVANAVFAATGKRVRTLPLSDALA